MAKSAGKVPTESKRDATVIPRIRAVPWMSKPRPGGIPGGVRKPLSVGTGGSMSRDSNLRVVTMFNHIPPWWSDPELVYHPCVEEAFILNGTVQLADRVYGPGCYVYRPPGILHGGALVPSDIGATLFHRFADEGGLLRYEGTELPHIDSQPITDEYEDWPAQWVERVDSGELPWLEVPKGPWEGAACKWLTRNRVTGGGTLLIKLPPYWTGVGSRAKGTIEEFVVEGACIMGGQYFDMWGYASISEVQLLCIWDEDEFAD